MDKLKEMWECKDNSGASRKPSLPPKPTKMSVSVQETKEEEKGENERHQQEQHQQHWHWSKQGMFEGTSTIATP